MTAPHKVLVVDVPLVVLVTDQELFGFLVTQFLPQCREEVAEFSRADKAVSILIEVSESLYEVITGVSGPPGADSLEIK